jgi:thioredoxin reductase (NADPH)
MANDAQYDLVIIGGGPAGLTAAIYGTRSLLKTVLLERTPVPGGQIVNTLTVENYPGLPDISGPELSQRFHEHALKFGAEIRNTNVSGVSFDGLVHVQTHEGEVTGRAALVCTGASHRWLGVPGEKAFIGRGISNCAVCDGFFFTGKDVLVVGGGDAAVEEGLYLTRFAKTVTIVHRRDALRAQKILQERAFANEKMRFLWDTVVEGITSVDDHLTGARLRNVKTGVEFDQPADGIFIYIGMTPNTGFLEGAAALDHEGFLVTDRRYRTTLPGVFAAGDVRSGAWRQVIAVAAEGALAVHEIEGYLTAAECRGAAEAWAG